MAQHVKEANIDAFIIAGDIHYSDYVRQRLIDDIEKEYNVKVFSVKGNHDYWEGEFPVDGQDMFVTEYKGYRIVGATYWTHLGPIEHGLARSFSDFNRIKDCTVDRWNTVHRFHQNAIISSKPDIVITHHPPTNRCVTSKFYNNPYNPFFVNNDEHIIMNSKAKLWVSGHVHSCHDFMIGSCRVVVNPLGYPNEFGTATQVKIVDLN